MADFEGVKGELLGYFRDIPVFWLSFYLSTDYPQHPSAYPFYFEEWYSSM
jgi:hypothetical protein